MRNALELNIKGIKCDTCNWRDETVKFEDYPKWLNKPCPVCGANLLTEADLKSVKRLIRLTKLFNKIFPKIDDNTKRVTASVEMDGTGEMKFRIKE